ncbi:MAG: hypothetical protein EBR02_10225 [Alphaproteobacteria bacterium]|nr:hypothetical protein [Alphaproteobacteria bacterium]
MNGLYMSNSSSPKSLKTLLTKKWLKKNASEKSYARGKKIFEDEWAVRIFESTPVRLQAEVMMPTTPSFWLRRNGGNGGGNEPVKSYKALVLIVKITRHELAWITTSPSRQLIVTDR